MDNDDLKNVLNDKIKEIEQEINSINKNVAYWNIKKATYDKTLENLLKRFNSMVCRRKVILKNITLAQSKLIELNKSIDIIKEAIKSFDD